MDLLNSPIHLEIETPPINPLLPGGGAWPISGSEHEASAWYYGAFNNAELDAIIRLGESLQSDRARIGGGAGGKIDGEYRSSQTAWIYPNEVSGWIFDRIARAIIDINAVHFRFDLTGLYQGLQFTKYEAPGEHYDWHQDRGPNCGIRKLSMSLQLSDPDTYTGGDLQFLHTKEETTFERRRGLMAIFPSWTLHRITPVTSGTRYSLVAWISGPPFR